MDGYQESADDIANELAGYQEEFDAAPMPEGSGVDGKVPDGDYQAEIRRVDVVRSKKTKKLCLRWKLKVIGPQCAGTELTKWNQFDGQEKLGYLKKDLAVVGIPFQLAKLEALLPDLDKKMVEIHVKTDKGYQNVYLNSASDTPF